jgi:hypothetical protein
MINISIFTKSIEIVIICQKEDRSSSLFLKKEEFFSERVVMNGKFRCKCHFFAVKQCFLVTALKKTCKNILYIWIADAYHMRAYQALRGEHNMM